jgi:hypothetical protein
MSSSASSGPSPIDDDGSGSSRNVGLRLNSLAGQLSHVRTPHPIHPAICREQNFCIFILKLFWNLYVFILFIFFNARDGA